MTNADKIRAMTDKELARTLAAVAGYEGNREEVGYWFNWLKAEAEGDEDDGSHRRT